MAKKDNGALNQRHQAATTRISADADPFLTSSANKRRSTSTIFNAAPAAKSFSSRLKSHLQNSPTRSMNSTLAEAKESPSYKAQQRAKVRQSQGTHSLSPIFKSTIIDYDDLDDIMGVVRDNGDDGKLNIDSSKVNGVEKSVSKANNDINDSESHSGSESDSSSSDESDDSHIFTLPPTSRRAPNTGNKPAILTIASPKPHSSLKRKLSAVSSSSSSDPDSGSSTSTSNPISKRLKASLPRSYRESSTVASRNPLPPAVANGSMKYQPTAPIKLDPRPNSTNTDNDNKTVLVDNSIKYPACVLTAARDLESVLPPYLNTADPLRPPAGSDETARLTKLLDSARKLILHLAARKVNEEETSMQSQMLRIAKERGQHLKVFEAEVRRLLAKK